MAVDRLKEAILEGRSVVEELADVEQDELSTLLEIKFGRDVIKGTVLQVAVGMEEPSPSTVRAILNAMTEEQVSLIDDVLGKSALFTWLERLVEGEEHVETALYLLEKTTDEALTSRIGNSSADKTPLHPMRAHVGVFTLACRSFHEEIVAALIPRLPAEEFEAKDLNSIPLQWAVERLVSMDVTEATPRHARIKEVFLQLLDATDPALLGYTESQSPVTSGVGTFGTTPPGNPVLYCATEPTFPNCLYEALAAKCPRSVFKSFRHSGNGTIFHKAIRFDPAKALLLLPFLDAEDRTVTFQSVVGMPGKSPVDLAKDMYKLYAEEPYLDLIAALEPSVKGAQE